MDRNRIMGNERGYTLIELVITVAILGLIIPALTLLFSKASQGFAADEMHTLLKKANQETMNHLHVRLGTNKRMVLNDTWGANFRGTLNMVGTPPVLTGSRLALIQPASFSKSGPASVQAISANFGNSLLFLAYDQSQTIVSGGTAQFFPAPATLLDVMDSVAAPHTLYVDLYRVYYYYLTTANPHAIIGIPSYALVEWKSIQYADYQQLRNLYFVSGGVTTGDATMQSNAISILRNQGITMAFNTSEPLGSPFYAVSITTGIPVTVLPPAPTATTLQAQWKNLTYVAGGVMSSGFKYGISSNSVTWQDAPVPVPQFGATVMGSPFPGGFEVGLGGTPAGREVMIRSVLTAKGAAPKVAHNDLVMSTNARDIW
jgi:prepilin-type N-terminal cleavage/methylation domain-containing protein